MPQEIQEKVSDETPASTAADVEMVESADAGGDGVDPGVTEHANDIELLFADDNIVEPRTTFASYLMTPIVTLLIGSGHQTILTAHQGLLTQSPYFETRCKDFVEDRSVSSNRELTTVAL